MLSVRHQEICRRNIIDHRLGFLIKQTLFGKNASINLTKVKPGANFRSHYHNASDEIDFVIQCEANITIDGEMIIERRDDPGLSAREDKTVLPRAPNQEYNPS